MKVAVIIPSRLASTRLEKKSLAMIGNKPMVVHVAERAKEAEVGEVFVACCGDEIGNVVSKAGFSTIVTDPALPSGTDRVYQAMKLIQQMRDVKYDYIVNVQGDMPFVDAKIIVETLRTLQNDHLADISTPVSNIWNEGEFENHNVVKAIISEVNNRALYFTRALMYNTYKHLGVYAYRADSLEKFVNLPVGSLEKNERLEQLRALENGMHIVTTLVDSDPISVDTHDDLLRARNHYEKFR